MIKNEQNINQFCSYFQANIDEIAKYNNRIHQKILIVTLLDTLSRVWRMGKEGRNKLRFLKLVRECINWEHSDKISIPITFYRLENVNFKANQGLKNKFKELFNKFQNGRMPRLDIDPFYSEIENLAENSEEKELLKNARHAELLYLYRNNLIHEFKEPGDGVEFSNDNTSPYYFWLTHIDYITETCELVYPFKFFLNLCNVALTSIKAFLVSNDLDPYTFFKFGSPW
jgi:hypothetical protein